MAVRKGKYAAITSKLPKFKGEDEERWQLVERVKQQIIEPVSDPPTPELLAAIVDTMNKGFQRLYALELQMTGGKRHASEFTRAYAHLRKVKDLIEEWGSNLNLLLEAYQALMIEHFEVEGVMSVRLDNGQLISTFEEPYAQVTDREAFRKWCLTNGLERSMALPWMTTNAVTKELLLKGHAEPDGVTVYAKTKVRLGSE